jgi:hypothetical protein
MFNFVNQIVKQSLIPSVWFSKSKYYQYYFFCDSLSEKKEICENISFVCFLGGAYNGRSIYERLPFGTRLQGEVRQVSHMRHVPKLSS